MPMRSLSANFFSFIHSFFGLLSQTEHLNFIVAASILMAETHGIKRNTDREYIRQVASKVEIIPFKPRSGQYSYLNVYLASHINTIR